MMTYVAMKEIRPLDRSFFKSALSQELCIHCFTLFLIIPKISPFNVILYPRKESKALFQGSALKGQEYVDILKTKET